jgi:ribosomal protein S18 acetylase RimI-like enzyme
MISPLPFDSSLFGYPVGKFLWDEDWEEEAFLEAAKEFSLVYIFAEKPISPASENIQLVDVKLTYRKSKLAAEPSPEEISVHSSGVNEQLEKLALQSGAYSRFAMDQRLKQREFEKLYSIWIQKEAKEPNLILIAPEWRGMVSYCLKGTVGTIGLIAVAEASQYKGWGKKLMKAVEQRVFAAGGTSISVTTQQANQPACNLYKTLGYELVEKTYVYHWCA